GEEGIYHEGTRYLSWFMLVVARDRPLFLNSTVTETNDLLTVDLMNPDLFRDGQIGIRRGTLHLFRSKLLWEAACYERLKIKNYGLAAVNVALSFHFEADYADIFEVRGMKRKATGRRLEPGIENGTVVLGYEGLDGVVRRSRLQFAPLPTEL